LAHPVDFHRRNDQNVKLLHKSPSDSIDSWPPRTEIMFRGGG